MKIRRLLIIMSASGALMLGPWAWARPDSSNLKSDLELELEGAQPEAPRKETPRISRPAPSAPVAEKRVSDLEARIQKAQQHMDRKEYEAVVATLIPVNDTLPRTGLLLLARAYAAKSDTLNEIRALELCIAKNPKDYVVQTVYGEALIRSKRAEDGIVAFQEARRLNPRYMPAYLSLLKELEKKGERYESRNVVNDMIKIFGPKPEFYTDLCRLYGLDSFNEKTIEICEAAIEKDPKSPDNHVFLGLALKDREETERANQVLTHAAKRFPASESVQAAMGELYISKKDFVSAYNYYKRATTANPKSARAWVGYGNAAFELQKNQEALDAFVKGCKADRLQTKDFRLAIGKLRVRKDISWQVRYESGINECQ